MPVEHADLAAREGVEGRLPVELARLDGAGEALADHPVAQELEGLDVVRGVDLVAVFVVGVTATARQHPHHRLGLRLFPAERQREGRLHTGGLELLGGRLQVRPALGLPAALGVLGYDTGVAEQLLVVEEQPGAGHEGHAVLGLPDLAGVGERREEVGLGLDGEQFLGGVELAGSRVVGVRADLRDVGGLVRLDHLGDLGVDLGPGVDADLDVDPGVGPLEGAREVLPVGGGGVLRIVAVVGRHDPQGHLVVPGEALHGSAARQGHGGQAERGPGRGQAQVTALHSSDPPLVVPTIRRKVYTTFGLLHIRNAPPVRTVSGPLPERAPGFVWPLNIPPNGLDLCLPSTRDCRL